jgi:hypothetical protein
VISAAEIRLDPAESAKYERAYRKGVHQSISFAADLVNQAGDLKEARRILRRAENLAFRLRFKDRNKGNLALLDYIKARLATRKRVKA